MDFYFTFKNSTRNLSRREMGTYFPWKKSNSGNVMLSGLLIIHLGWIEVSFYQSHDFAGVESFTPAHLQRTGLPCFLQDSRDDTINVLKGGRMIRPQTQSPRKKKCGDAHRTFSSLTRVRSTWPLGLNTILFTRKIFTIQNECDHQQA